VIRNEIRQRRLVDDRLYLLSDYCFWIDIYCGELMTEAQTFNCPTCGAPVQNMGIRGCKCEYCGNLLFIENGKIRAEIETLNHLSMKKLDELVSKYSENPPLTEDPLSFEETYIILGVVSSVIWCLFLNDGEILNFIFFLMIGWSMLTLFRTIIVMVPGKDLNIME
jgi:hypothetical protein